MLDLFGGCAVVSVSSRGGLLSLDYIYYYIYVIYIYTIRKTLREVFIIRWWCVFFFVCVLSNKNEEGVSSTVVFGRIFSV